MKKLLLSAMLLSLSACSVVADGVTTITSVAQFDKTVADNETVFVDFYADWCGPCKQLSPVIHALATEYPNITFVKVNIDNVRALADRYSIRSIPTLLFFKDGKQVRRESGFQSKAKLRTILNTF